MIRTKLLTQDEYRDLKESTDGVFGGLGMLVGIRENVLTVIQAIPKSPAYFSGIHNDDKIISINGKDTYGFSIDDLIVDMRGRPGTSVDLSVLGDYDFSERKISIVRKIVNIDSVELKILKSRSGSQIAYLNVSGFSMRTKAGVAFKYRRQNNNIMNGIVLDLREKAVFWIRQSK